MCDGIGHGGETYATTSNKGFYGLALWRNHLTNFPSPFFVINFQYLARHLCAGIHQGLPPISGGGVICDGIGHGGETYATTVSNKGFYGLALCQITNYQLPITNLRNSLWWWQRDV